jgi:hypothetical protein
MNPYAPFLIAPVGYLSYWVLLSRSRGKLFTPYLGYDSYEDLRKVSWRWFVAVMAVLVFVIARDLSAAGGRGLLAPAFALGYFLAHARFLVAPVEKWQRR